MSVHLSAWNNSATTGRIFMKFDIRITSGPEEDTAVSHCENKLTLSADFNPRTFMYVYI